MNDFFGEFVSSSTLSLVRGSIYTVCRFALNEINRSQSFSHFKITLKHSTAQQTAIRQFKEFQVGNLKKDVEKVDRQT